jgi:hypothetical protein
MIGRAVALTRSRPAKGVKEGLRPEQTSFIGRQRELAEIGQALGRTTCSP